MNFFKKIKEIVASIHNKRKSNSEKYKATNLVLLVAFPLFISVLVEIIQMKSPAKFVIFLFRKPMVVLFNVMFLSLVFIALLFLLKRAFLAMAAIGITLTTFSIIELFKFNTSGNHLILTDLRMAANVSHLKSFAYVKVTPSLVAYVALLAIYLAAAFWFNPAVKIKFKRRLVSASACLATVLVVVISPAIAVPVYSFFDIDTSPTDNVFRLNEKFTNNNLIAFLAQTTTEFLNKKIVEPEDYSVDVITDMLHNVPKDDNGFKKPNILFIQSEAFTDFRIFDELDISDDIYASYDRIRASDKTFTGNAVVPAFGSFTVKTEFELMFGLPVKSLNDPNMPMRLLLDRPQQTVPAFYQSLGYNTSFIHPFDKTFYSRERVYANCGFDNFYWDDSFTVPVEKYKTYISDTTIFNQIDKIFDETADPAFVFTVTMQNHQPYNPTEECPTQLDYYLAGVKDMTQNLEKFLNSIEEPTVVIFIGDHFPCFKGEESIYNQLDINGENCNSLYVQPYFIWNNYEMDYNEATKDIISAFYLPYILSDLIDAPKDNLTQTMLDKIKDTPIYSTNYDNTVPDDEQLNMFTYDIVKGKQFLKEGTNEDNSTANNK